MSFDNVGQARAEKFRETGRFVLEDLVTNTGHVSGGDLIPPEKLIALLEILHIIAAIVPVQHSTSSKIKETRIGLPDALCSSHSQQQKA